MSSSRKPSKSTSSAPPSQGLKAPMDPKAPQQQDDQTTDSAVENSENVSHHPQAGAIRLQRPHRSPAADANRPQPSSASTPTQSSPSSNESSSLPAGQHPIPPPSEPMQYRAIGLVQGQYQPSEEQFNRGTLITTEDDVNVDTVLLGQVMSLVKKYLDLEQSYLWVVYPRTREKDEGLHLQIVGVWSQEGFGPMAAERETSSPRSEAGLADPLKDGYFSIRGQVVHQDPDKNQILVKIQQAPRKGDDHPRSFKLNLSGNLGSTRTIGYFWDFQVQRDGSCLTIQDGTSIGMVPPEKKTKKARTSSSAPQKRRNIQPKPKERIASPSSASWQEPRVITKPIKRRSNSSSNSASSEN